MKLVVPPVFAVDTRIHGNRVRKLARRDEELEGKLVEWSRNRLRGHLFTDDADESEVLLLAKGDSDRFDRVIRTVVAESESTPPASVPKWIRHPLSATIGAPDLPAAANKAAATWGRAFRYIEQSGEVQGLRGAQLGALHAAQSRWTISNEPATIVMPTGTGKTEVMLSLLISRPISKLLLVVPTDALRHQIAEKFVSLGVLRSPGCEILADAAEYPVVCTLEHVPRTEAEVDAIFGSSNVVVATSSIIAAAGPAIRRRIAVTSPYLFIDEAHHVEAPTWKAFKEDFRLGHILQFTATPFREDGKALEGPIIFKYPLRKAQEDGYFTKIRFERVVEFNHARADAAIAARAVEILREGNERHILMARAGTVARANAIFALYNKYPEFHPVQLHTGITSTRERDAIRRQITSGESRIVVCVDMLGEGFDLPELKVAAFHDIRKTLAVTLQLAGRFTRSRGDLGEATFIANTADLNVQDELRKLYARDPDWNVLLPEMSEKLIGQQISLQEFLRGFGEFAEEIPLRTVKPALSTVVYRTDADEWTPSQFASGIPNIASCAQVHHAVNEDAHTLIVVTARRVPLAWADIDALYGWEWELYVAIWSPEQKLLYINGSTNAGTFRGLAEALVSAPKLIRDADVFRAFAGIKRLQLQNVGLSEHIGRNLRYTGRMGSNVGEALGAAARRRTTKSVLAGRGYEGGRRADVGGSRRGRIWSHRRERVNGLRDWCFAMGAKLIDESIDPNEVLQGTLEAKVLSSRPFKMPLVIDWPEEVYTTPEAQWWVAIGGSLVAIDEVDLELVTPTTDGALRFAIVAEVGRVEYELELYEEDDEPNYRFKLVSESDVQIQAGLNVDGRDGREFFEELPPPIWFHDGSSLEGNQLVELKHVPPPFKAESIEPWDWQVDITKESQGSAKDKDSIQAQVIERLRAAGYYTVIFDDDDRGEAADVVTVRLVQENDIPKELEVEFYHLKFSRAPVAGGRVEDLYEVCGQTQKSIAWMNDDRRTDLFTHLLRREARRAEQGLASRFEVGDNDTLLTLREVSYQCPIRMSMCIVQPGLSKKAVTNDQLMLLGVTADHLMETYQIPMRVVGSA